MQLITASLSTVETKKVGKVARPNSEYTSEFFAGNNMLYKVLRNFNYTASFNHLRTMCILSLVTIRSCCRFPERSEQVLLEIRYFRVIRNSPCISRVTWF